RLAEQRIAEARYQDARNALNAVLDPQYDPNYRPAIQLLAQLDDPERFNQTMGPKFIEKIRDVDQLFMEAKGFYDSGRYDLAYKRYDQILDLDPTNISARKGQEDVNTAKLRYTNEAYNETRALLLYQVTKKWETQPRNYVNKVIEKVEVTAINPHNTEYIKEKLDHIIIPQLNLRDATITDAINFLHQKSIDLDTTETDPLRKGVNIVLKLDVTPGNSAVGAPPPEGAVAAPEAAVGGAAAASAEPRITLNLSNIPLSAALDFTTKLAGLKYKIEPYAVKIVPLSENIEQLITKEYKVPPGFLTTASGGAAAAGPVGGAPIAAVPGGAVGTPVTPTGLTPKVTAEDYLKNSGVTFPEGASASFLPSSSKLVVRNTPENLDLVDQIVDVLNNTQPTQVSVEAKFVEIQQTNYKELSFDYSLGSGNLGKIQYIGGNTAGPTTTFPFLNIFGGGQVTTGLRSGGEAIGGDAVDTLLNPGTNVPGEPAPPTFAVSGVVTAAQFQALYRALNQKKGVDLLSAPSVTTKSGQRAVVEVVVEFRYPTEFTPPQIPNIPAGGFVGTGNYTAVTPTTPAGFETRNTGVTLEVEPVIGPDGETIDLNLAPQVVEFDGFVNYGTPIYGAPQPIFSPIFIPGFGFPVIGYSPPAVVTQNAINQPIFDTRKVTTSVSVWDGQTVIIGGLVREDVQTVEDKLPGLGDLPILGRFFRSNVDQHIKRNLVMFVTAHLVNPAGDLVHGEEEKEEEQSAGGPVPPLSFPELPDAPLPK
ncbi:MAG TPA: Amuc_1098 family type IV pilus outer membrane protein, partial [Chthoniobacteraceae bacterium]|nr:Amuc_1098 family type IV pilus outer membrane protein [Chthoniobacteraceae bacterium]